MESTANQLRSASFTDQVTKSVRYPKSSRKMTNLKVGFVGPCVICCRTVRKRSSLDGDRDGAVGDKGTREQEYLEMAPRSVVSTSQFLRTFNEIWQVFQKSDDNSDSVPRGMSLETVMMMERMNLPTNVKFTKEAPPTMCQQCCDKIITVDSLMKVVRQQAGEIKVLIMESNSNMGSSNQGSGTDGIQVKDEIENPGETSNCQEDFQEDVQMPSIDDDDNPLHNLIAENSSSASSSTIPGPGQDDDGEGQLTSEIEIHEEKVTLIDPTASVDPAYSIVQLACSVTNCNEIFDSYYNFMEHQKSCHSPVVPIITTATNNEPIYKDNKYFCPKCDKDLTSFTLNRSRKLHIKECGQPPRYQCPFCQVKIGRRGTFKTHLKRFHL